MKYVALLYGDEKLEAKMSQDEWQKMMEGHNQFSATYGDKVLGGEALEPTGDARTIRIKDGAPLTFDGPFAETKEQLGGFYILEAENIEEAVRMVKNLPLGEPGSIEVRPVMEIGTGDAG